MFVGLSSWVFSRAVQAGEFCLLDFPRMAREEYGVDSIEVHSLHFTSQSAEYLNELRRRIADAGLQVRNIAVDTGFVFDPDPEVRRTNLEALKQWLHVGRAIGSQAVRVHSGEVAMDDAPALAALIEGYRELLAEAAGCGVKLVVENHDGISHHPAGLRYILGALDVPHLATCPDTGNSEADDWEEVLDLLAPKAHSVHVKILSYDPSGVQPVRRRDGSIRLQDLHRDVRTLAAAGFRGQLTYAYTAPDADERDAARRGLEYIRELVGIS